MAETFEIGFTMAGAISAGAYTAGVMDFFIEALDSYYEAKKQPGWDGPVHDVRIPIMAGASAGGMTSAICALHAFRDRFDHVWPRDEARNIPDRHRNRLYSSWVEDIDIEPLCETTDLEKTPSESVRSLLCCDVIDRIVKDAFDMDGAIVGREWIGRGDDRSLRLRLTVTSLRGVPYSFQIYGAHDPRRYGMLNHGEFVDFKIGVAPTPSDGAYALDISNTKTDDWELFRTVAKATGAFPIGLAPRRLSRHPLEYRFASRIGYGVGDAYRIIDPDQWLFEPANDPYKFIAVDGGTVDNEPLEMTRRYLSGGATERNASDGFNTTKAVILVAPFPNYIEAKTPNSAVDLHNRDIGLMSISGALLTALVNQARFKPDELKRAADDEYYSRYLIAPSRDSIGTPESIAYPIACGVMGGFGGFLHKSFRRHDYLLGRRNAQAFLRWHFNLPENAGLFTDFKGDVEKWLVRTLEDPAKPKRISAAGRTNLRALPIIPLTERLNKEIVIPPEELPTPQELFEEGPARRALERRLAERARGVVDRLVDVDLKFNGGPFGWLERVGAKRVGAKLVTNKAIDAVHGAIEDVMKAFYKQSGAP